VELVGDIDTFPKLTLSVATGNSRRSIRLVVDTGFDGELALPHSFMPFFRASPDAHKTEFADGHQKLSLIVPCKVGWVDGWRDVEAIYIDGRNPLLGMELLQGCFVEIDLTVEGGEIVVRSGD
jgi:predicted aspartyl protease